METLARWLRGLLRRRSSPDQPPEMKKKKPWLLCGSSRVGRDMNNTNTSKKWSFRSKDTVLSSSSSVEEHHKTGENEHAVAVAAAAAEAAMVAAAEVLRLTKRLQVPKEEDIAALRIQAAFRGYLARRALLALKGLVRLQAVLRGHIARKRVVDMLRTATLPKARLPAPVSPGKSSDLLHIKSGPTTPEKYENTLAKSRSARVYTPPSPMVRKIFISSSKPRRKLAYDHHKNLLDQLMERRNAQLRPHERSIRIDTSDDEKITLKSFHSLFNNKMPTSSHTQEHSATSYSSSPEFPFKQLPIRAHKTNNRNPVPSTRIDCIPSGDTSPRISTSSKTDAFSVISNLSGWSGSYPSYMAGTASSRAKSRSRSAPRDRPEVGRPILMRQLPAGAVHGGRLIGGKSGCLESMAHSNKVAPMSSTQAKLTSKAKVGSSRFML